MYWKRPSLSAGENSTSLLPAAWAKEWDVDFSRVENFPPEAGVACRAWRRVLEKAPRPASARPTPDRNTSRPRLGRRFLFYKRDLSFRKRDHDKNVTISKDIFFRICWRDWRFLRPRGAAFGWNNKCNVKKCGRSPLHSDCGLSTSTTPKACGVSACRAGLSLQKCNVRQVKFSQNF